MRGENPAARPLTDRQLGRRGPARRDPRGGGGQQAARRVDELREEPDAQRAAEREHAELQKLQAQRRTASARPSAKYALLANYYALSSLVAGKGQAGPGYT